MKSWTPFACWLPDLFIYSQPVYENCCSFTFPFLSWSYEVISQNGKNSIQNRCELLWDMTASVSLSSSCRARKPGASWRSRWTGPMASWWSTTLATAPPSSTPRACCGRSERRAQTTAKGQRSLCLAVTNSRRQSFKCGRHKWLSHQLLTLAFFSFRFSFSLHAHSDLTKMQFTTNGKLQLRTNYFERKNTENVNRIKKKPLAKVLRQCKRRQNLTEASPSLSESQISERRKHFFFLLHHFIICDFRAQVAAALETRLWLSSFCLLLKI